MKGEETLEKFYQLRFPAVQHLEFRNSGHFNIFKVEDVVGPGKPPVTYTRRDFFKIALMRGHHIYHYANKSLEVRGNTLLFFNPEIPYTFNSITQEPTGYFCIFRESFFSEYLRNSLRDLPMYQIGGNPAFILDDTNHQKVVTIFEKMLEEMDANYAFKYDLIRNYIIEVVHAALKLQPSQDLCLDTDANARITAVFMELLERQFPIESPSQQFAFRSAKDFADKLCIHVNHLNKAIKTVTGRTTSSLIYERLINEAKALLKHTHWNIAEIGFCLGFEDPTHFNHFFRKQANAKPTDFRK